MDIQGYIIDRWLDKMYGEYPVPIVYNSGKIGKIEIHDRFDDSTVSLAFHVIKEFNKLHSTQ